MPLPKLRRHRSHGASLSAVRFMCAVLGGALLFPTAQAATSPTTGHAQVQASVINSCRVVSITGLSFGTTYNPVQSGDQVVQLSGQVDMLCTQGAQGWVAMDQGQHANSDSTCTAPDRRLFSTVNSGTFLNYGIFFNTSGANTAWGCDASVAPTFAAVSSKSTVSLAAIAQIPAGQDVPPGTYTDQVMVTVNF